jgi:hypothetical protein
MEIHMPDHAMLSSKLEKNRLTGRNRTIGLHLPYRPLTRVACLREDHFRRRLFNLFLFLSIAALFYCSTANAAQVTLAWDPVQPAPEGYRLYSRTESGAYNYAAPAWSGTTSTCTINNLADNTAYRFVVRAYVGSNQSGNSNEVQYTPPSPVNQPPVANAGSDQTVAARATVTLNGSGSDPEGQTLRYLWRQTSGTAVQLSNSTVARPTFTAPAVTSGSTTLAFSLTVTDPQNASASDTCQVVVNAATTNQPPVANAGSDQTVAARATVTLNGSGSDPEGQTLRYQWRQTGGTAVQLSNSTVARPTFTAPAVTSGSTTLAFSLTVTDPQNASASDTCQVVVNAATINQPPVAEAGPNQIVLANNQVTLNGSGSSDPEKQALTYRWVQKSGPAVNLQNASTARPGFTAPRVTSYVQTLGFELRVTDPKGLSSADTCLVMVVRRRGDATTDEPQLSISDSSRTNLPPYEPTLVSPQPAQTDVADTLSLVASDFDDPDSDDRHLLTQWQIRRSDDQRLVMDLTCEMEPLNQLQVPDLILDPNTRYTCRFRYYDSRAEASPWSREVSFSTAPTMMDANGNGIPDAQEADPRADLNADGIPDNEQGLVIKTLKTTGGLLQIGVSIETSESAVAIERAALLNSDDLPDAPCPATEMPYGLMASKIEVDKPGSETVVRFLYSDPLPGTAHWLRHDPIWGWHECGTPSERMENGLVIERRLTDGGPDDADGIANGIIVDLAGPRFITDAGLGADEPSGSGGGGGGGCFIQSLPFGRW